MVGWKARCVWPGCSWNGRCAQSRESRNSQWETNSTSYYCRLWANCVNKIVVAERSTVIKTRSQKTKNPNRNFFPFEMYCFANDQRCLYNYFLRWYQRKKENSDSVSYSTYVCFRPRTTKHIGKEKKKKVL